MIFVYAGLGLLKFLLTFSLTRNCEIKTEDLDDMTPEASSETSPLLSSNSELQKAPKRLIPSMSRESIVVLVKLCLLFTLESFASGLVTRYVAPKQHVYMCLLRYH